MFITAHSGCKWYIELLYVTLVILYSLLMQYANSSRQRESHTIKPPFPGFISPPAIPYATSSNLFYQSPSVTLQNVIAPVEQLYYPFSAPAYEGPDTTYGAVPADSFPVTSTSFQKLVPQPSSGRPMPSGKFIPPMDYSSFWADTQQSMQRSNLDCGQGDVVAHYRVDAMTIDSQHVSGTFFDEIPAMQCQWATNSYTVPLSENTSTYTKPQLTSPANRKASDARRRRAAKYVCEMCGACLTAKHNLITHQNVHLGLKPFRCEICQKGFAAKATYRRHTKTVHRDQV